MLIFAAIFKTYRIVVNLFRSAVFAGIAIGVAGFCYLAIGGIVGAFVFSFGLLTVLGYKLKLFTGTAGFIEPKEMPTLFLILVGNIVGCLLIALMTRVSSMPLQETVQKIMEGRLSAGPLKCGILAIGCGFIMTTVVTFGREKHYLPLLLGVPLFIFSGFPHCLVDAFYTCALPVDFLSDHIGGLLAHYGCIVLGNFVGCNLYRIVLPKALR